MHQLHPAAQGALLVDRDDRRASPAILQGCALGQVENYLHKPWLFGTKFVFARHVANIAPRGAHRALRLSDGTDVVARAVVIAKGASYRRLGLPRVERFTDAGIYYVTPGDARFHKEQRKSLRSLSRRLERAAKYIGQ